MSFWWIDRTLPGIVGGLAVSLPVWISHFWLKRHVTRTADRQTADLRSDKEARPDEPA
jgi:hypothetical protein